MNKIPEFDENGNLPPNENYWWATLEEIKERFGQGRKRAMLFEYLIKLCKLLKNGGCKTLYLDGSFITSKERPADYDCCFKRGELDDATKRTIFPTPGDDAHTNWYLHEHFKADIFFSDEQYDFSLKLNRPIYYLDFFQQNRGIPKGIIAIDLTKENL